MSTPQKNVGFFHGFFKLRRKPSTLRSQIVIEQLLPPKAFPAAGVRRKDPSVNQGMMHGSIIFYRCLHVYTQYNYVASKNNCHYRCFFLLSFCVSYASFGVKVRHRLLNHCYRVGCGPNQWSTQALAPASTMARVIDTRGGCAKPGGDSSVQKTSKVMGCCYFKGIIYTPGPRHSMYGISIYLRLVDFLMVHDVHVRRYIIHWVSGYPGTYTPPKFNRHRPWKMMAKGDDPFDSTFGIFYVTFDSGRFGANFRCAIRCARWIPNTF